MSKLIQQLKFQWNYEDIKMESLQEVDWKLLYELFQESIKKNQKNRMYLACL
jgi:hypothetical protein